MSVALPEMSRMAESGLEQAGELPGATEVEEMKLVLVVATVVVVVVVVGATVVRVVVVRVVVVRVVVVRVVVVRVVVVRVVVVRVVREEVARVERPFTATKVTVATTPRSFAAESALKVTVMSRDEPLTESGIVVPLACNKRAAPVLAPL